eukprot:TRINITY_DN67191_c8_g2_i1.p1 TRINITY_DN67191_c8_g2~~TRINITY_DN67191_c8_g2_i1.p1  ORF type:complete len:384 (-),score=35.62 TRINITY_DN67191_c8_g2_i1:1803-2954(-)
MDALVQHLEEEETSMSAAEIQRAEEERLAKWKAEQQEPVVLGPLDTSAPTPRFAADDPALLDYLEEHGYVVVQNVLSATETQEAHSMFWDFVEALPHRTIRRDSTDTWEDDWPAHAQNGIFSGLGIGQSDFMWFIRTRPAVKKAFATVWNSTDLLSSFDGCGTFRPPSVNPSWTTLSGWFHVDQGRAKIGKCCVQGLVSIFDQTAATGGLTVIPGSHKQHAKWIQNYDYGRRDFVLLRDSEKLLELPSKLVLCKAGDLLLWDSRTVHCNSPGIESERMSVATDRLSRLVGYVCMTPASQATRKVIRQRKWAYCNWVGTTHWPHEYWPTSGIPRGRTKRKFGSATNQQQALIVGEKVHFNNLSLIWVVSALPVVLAILVFWLLG